MPKAVLVMNYMPTRCCDCELENDVKINKTICHVSLRDISDSEYSQKKPDWCPLRELPEKKESDSFLTEAVQNDCFDGTDSDVAYFNGKDAGFNACLDAITGK